MKEEEKLKVISEVVEYTRQIRIKLDQLYDGWAERYAARTIIIKYLTERGLKPSEAEYALQQLG
jgi:hypothetical protein